MNREQDHREDREFEELVERMRTDQAPPETPRERMWEKIAAARAGQRSPGAGTAQPARGREPWPWWRLAAAALAILVLGIAAGRMLPREDAVGPVPVAEAPAPAAEAGKPRPAAPGPDDLMYQTAAVRLFGRADALLTEFKTATCDQKDMEPVPGWATDMLIQTRLLLDAGESAGVDADGPLHQLLLDLELTLVQISGLSAEDCRQETEWIREGMKRRSTVERVRLMVAAGTARPL